MRVMAGPWTGHLLWVLSSGGPMRYGVLKRAVAGISAKVVFVGLGKSFQIWDPAQHQFYQKQVRDRALSDRQALRRRPQAMPDPSRPVESGT